MKKTSQSFGFRPGIQDMWNSFMVDGANFSRNDIPFCPTNQSIIPTKLISFEVAKATHRKELSRGNDNYHINAFIHFYDDDQKFNGPLVGIWNAPKYALEVIRHYDGIITPDFSTYIDFPDPLKRVSTYMMRAFGYWISCQNIPIINNVRWGTVNSWEYCFDGIPHNSVVAIGTVASNPRLLDNRPLFEEGLKQMVTELNPHTIIVYGSASNIIFEELIARGINVVSFQSHTASALAERKKQ